MGAERFDIVVAANVLHATRDLRRTAAHVKSLLAPGGTPDPARGHRALSLGGSHVRAHRRVVAVLGCRSPGRACPARSRAVARSPRGERVRGAAPACPPPPRAARSRVRRCSWRGFRRRRSRRRRPDRDWLVLADASGVGRRVAEILEGRPEHRVTVIEPGADAAARLEEAIGSGPAWHALLDLRALDAPAGAAPETIDATTRLCEQTAALVRTLAASGGAPRRVADHAGRPGGRRS